MCGVCVCVCGGRGGEGGACICMYLYMCVYVCMQVWGMPACVFLCVWACGSQHKSVFCFYLAIVSWFTSDLMHQNKISRCREDVCLFNVQDSCSFRHCVSAFRTLQNNIVYHTDINL